MRFQLPGPKNCPLPRCLDLLPPIPLKDRWPMSGLAQAREEMTKPQDRERETGTSPKAGERKSETFHSNSNLQTKIPNEKLGQEFKFNSK